MRIKIDSCGKKSEFEEGNRKMDILRGKIIGVEMKIIIFIFICGGKLRY
jgi:hypothetical protein